MMWRLRYYLARLLLAGFWRAWPGYDQTWSVYLRPNVRQLYSTAGTRILELNGILVTLSAMRQRKGILNEYLKRVVES